MHNYKYPILGCLKLELTDVCVVDVNLIGANLFLSSLKSSLVTTNITGVFGK